MFDVERDEQLRQWINAGPETETPEHTDVIMWGVWFDVNGDEHKPPVAMFGTEAEATAYANLMDRNEYAVSPCIVGLRTRDNFEIPEPE